jgi:nucleoside-diphosphate-sugar epimerase
VGNIVAFIQFLIREKTTGYQVFNYVDKPDFTTNELVKHVGKVLQKHIPTVHIPYWLGMLGGYCFDVLAFITRKKLPISAVRVKKFCATTKFDAQAAHNSDFQSPFSLGEGLERTLKYECLHPQSDNITFVSE